MMYGLDHFVNWFVTRRETFAGIGSYLVLAAALLAVGGSGALLVLAWAGK